MALPPIETKHTLVQHFVVNRLIHHRVDREKTFPVSVFIGIFVSPAYSLDKGLLTDSEDLFLVSLISTHSDGGSGGGSSLG